MVIRCILLGCCGSQPSQRSSPPYAYSPAQSLHHSPPPETRSTMKSMPTLCPAHFATFQHSPEPNPSANAPPQMVTPPTSGATAGSLAPTHTLGFLYEPLIPKKKNRNTDPSTTQLALVPVLPAAARLSIFYARLVLLSSSFPPNLSAGSPAILNGMAGQMVRFQFGGLEIRFFSMTTLIPWSFVRTVVARLRENTVMGFTGLHSTVFTHETTGLVVFVTVMAVGVPVPGMWLS